MNSSKNLFYFLFLILLYRFVSHNKQDPNIKGNRSKKRGAIPIIKRPSDSGYPQFRKRIVFEIIEIDE